MMKRLLLAISILLVCVIAYAQAVFATKGLNSVMSILTAVSADTYAISGRSNSSITSNLIYEGAVGPGTNPAPAFDAVRGVANSPAGTSVLTTSGVAGYVQNDTVQGANGFTGAVGVFGVGISDADNTSTWGIDTICSDHTNQVVSTGVGRACFNEFDFNMTSPNSTASGLIIGGTWLAQPQSATGVTIFKPNGTGIWQYGYGTQDGATGVFARIGAQANTGNSVNSQNVNFYWRDASGNTQNTTIAATPSGFLIAGGTPPSSSTGASGSLVLNNGAFYLNPIAAPPQPSSGEMVLYVDSADNKLKAKGSSGTVTILAVP